jgi:hypothetical protein
MRWPWVPFLACMAVIALHCGARTPLDDIEPGTSTGTSAATGSSSTTADTSATTSGTQTGGETTTGVGGATIGAGGATIGAGGASTTTATTSTTGTTTTGVGGTGGRGGIGGGGFGGAPGAGGRGAGGRGAGGRGAGGGGNTLLGILPGINATPACTMCVNTRCNAAAACSSDPACVAGVSCYIANCAMMGNGNAQRACSNRCFQGNAMVQQTAVQAVTCIYGACGGPC